MDQRTRKLMTMRKALHPRDGIERLCVSRKEDDREGASIKGLDDYIKKNKENETHEILWDF